MFNTSNRWELFRADPFKGRLPSPLFDHVDFLDELQASQNISDVVQPPHFGYKHRTRENVTITKAEKNE